MKVYYVDFRNKTIIPKEVDGGYERHTFKTLALAKKALKDNLNNCILSEKEHIAKLQKRIDLYQFKINEL